MAFDILSFVMGKAAAGNSGGGSGGDTGRTTLLEKADYSFGYIEQFSAFSHSNSSLLFELEEGKEYIVEWDGTEYKRTAFAFTGAGDTSCVGLGNPIAAGQADNGDKFAVVIDKTNSYTHLLSLEQTATHSVAIYMESNANGGSDELSYEFFTGSFKATAQQMTVEHTCGKVPDILIVNVGAVPGVGNISYTIGFSKAMLEKLGEEAYNKVVFVLSATGGTMQGADKNGIENTPTDTLYTNYGGVKNATSTTFDIGGTDGGLQIDKSYSWTAICGLT